MGTRACPGAGRRPVAALRRGTLGGRAHRSAARHGCALPSRTGFAPRDLAGVIAIAGPHDFLPITEADIAGIFGPPERYPESQPVNFVDGDEPPFLLLHGSDDDLVRPRNSVSLAERLQAADEPCELKLYPGVGHIRILAAMDLSYERLAPTLDDVKAFVGR